VRHLRGLSVAQVRAAGIASGVELAQTADASDGELLLLVLAIVLFIAALLDRPLRNSWEVLAQLLVEPFSDLLRENLVLFIFKAARLVQGGNLALVCLRAPTAVILPLARVQTLFDFGLFVPPWSFFTLWRSSS